MYRVAICDDQREYLEIVEDKLNNYCNAHNISIALKSYNDSQVLVEELGEGKRFDAYILDIEMDKYSGIEIANIVGTYSDIACIVFLTAFSNYAIEVCGMNIFRYVLKEKLEESFPRVLDEMFHRLSWLDNQEIYTIVNQRKYIKFLQREIIYIYKDQKNIVFVLKGGRKEQERTTLQKAYKKLNSRELIFLDRGIILNLFHVERVEEQRVFMKEGYSVASSLPRISELKRFLFMYWGEII